MQDLHNSRELRASNGLHEWHSPWSTLPSAALLLTMRDISCCSSACSQRLVDHVVDWMHVHLGLDMLDGVLKILHERHLPRPWDCISLITDGPEALHARHDDRLESLWLRAQGHLYVTTE